MSIAHLATVTSGAQAGARQYSMVIAWSPEDRVYIVSFPEFPVARTHGSTAAEAAAMGEEVLADLLAIREEQGIPAPPAPRTSRWVVIDPPPRWDRGRAREARESAGISQQVLAAALNVSDSAVQAWEQGRRRPEGAALRLLELFQRHPELLEELIHEKPSARPPS